MGKLDDVTWINYNHIPFLKDNNSSAPLQKGRGGSGWFTVEETSCTNYSNDFLNVDEGELFNEGNACGDIIINVIEITTDNDYIHILHDMPNRYMYR